MKKANQFLTQQISTVIRSKRVWVEGSTNKYADYKGREGSTNKYDDYK